MAAQRGEIYFVNLEPAGTGDDINIRPVLVLSINAINRLPLVVTVVVGTSGERLTRDYFANIRVPSDESGLAEEVVFLGFQIRSLSARRLSSRPAGRVSGNILRQVEEAVRYCLGL